MSGFTVRIIPLQNNAIWNIHEIIWIKWLKLHGFDLVNETDGGEGCLGPCSMDRKLKVSKALKGKKKSPEYKKKISQSQVGRKLSNETKRRISDSLKGRYPKNLEDNWKALKGTPKTESHKKKLSESLKGRTVTPKHKLLKNLEKARKALNGMAS